MRHLALALPFFLLACSDGADAPGETIPETKTPQASTDLSIPYEKYELENGLDVILHVDRSDPVVAIDIAAHVGSARETEGRTGFAHLFEHLLFLDSENLGYGGLDEMNTRIGGEGTNGFTTHDMTQYFQAVPKDGLEKIIWAEADKIGWFINTMNQNVIDREKQVVKNEKRQRVDNQPYGHSFTIINETLYPEDHPYSWTVIGSLADLEASTIKDTRDFFNRWYVPNNVTVTLSGDFEVDEAKRLMEKYFGEIPRGVDVPQQTPRPAVLEETQSLYYEDNFATVPRLITVWPTVEQYHPDSYALDVLATYLTDGKEAPLRKVMVDEDKVTTSVSAFNYAKELAGEFYIFVDALEGADVDGLIPSIEAGMAAFEADGIPEDALQRIKTQAEVSIYDQLQSALGKAIQMSEYNLFTGDPAYVTTELERLRALTPADITRVYETYIKGQNRLYLSVVPKDNSELKLDETYPAREAAIVEEEVVQGAEADVPYDPDARVFEPTPSAFDRTVEPAFGAAYTLPTPDVTRRTLDNGLEVYLLPSDETPLVQFSLRLDAGFIRNDLDSPAIAGLTADMLSKGTASKTTAELEDAIKDLGSEISVSAGDRAVFVTGKTLARNYDATIDLVQEMLFEPRWDADEFAILKTQRSEAITQAEGQPNAIAARELAKLRYPEASIFHHAGLTGYGPREALEDVTLDDLKSFHADNYSLAGAKLRAVGAIGMDTIATAWSAEGLPTGEPRDPVTVTLTPVEEATIYFYDVPGAKQSVIRASRPALSALDPDYGLAESVNFPLGGIYTSKLNTELRVNKGYTYGIRSGFSGAEDGGTFGIFSSVRSNVTRESLELMRQIIGDFGQSFTEDELATLKDARLRGEALKTETLSDKLSLLGDVSVYGYGPDYRVRNAERLQEMSLEEFRAFAGRYITPDEMVYLVVGDADTQLEPVKSLGLPVVELN